MKSRELMNICILYMVCFPFVNLPVASPHSIVDCANEGILQYLLSIKLHSRHGYLYKQFRVLFHGFYSHLHLDFCHETAKLGCSLGDLTSWMHENGYSS